MKKKRNAKSPAKKAPVPSSSTSTNLTNKSSSSILNTSRRKQAKPKKKASGTILCLVGKKYTISEKIMSEINRLQLSSKFVIPKLPFARLVKEICMQYGPRDLRIQAVALTALQTALETYMVEYFEDSYLCALHAKRITLFVRDMQLVRQLRRMS